LISGIADRAVFGQIRKSGRHVRSADLRFRFLTTGTGADLAGTPQVAYSISRKVGNAVVRNRLRRRLRAILTEELGDDGSLTVLAAVVIVLPGARDRTFLELQGQVQELMKKADESSENVS
jgi:ribonuclease P protein component